MMHPTDFIYLALVCLVGGVVRAWAWASSRGLPEAWRLRLAARPPADLSPGWIWLHAVSVGELLLSEGLAGRLLDTGHHVHITTGTPAGLALLRARRPAWDRGRGLLSGGAFPLDDPTGLRPFLNHPPGVFIALETELWPNLLRQLEARAVPRLIVNGRLTEKSQGWGAPWLRRAAQRLSLVAARDPQSAKAFRRLGAPVVSLGGNLKGDLALPAPLGEPWKLLRLAWRQDPILVAGSTLEGEEAHILAVWSTVRQDYPSLRLILAPRQPRRFEEVAEWLTRSGLLFRRASQAWPETPETWADCQVLLLDTLGELPAVYGEGTLALVGGGWLGQGGHNPLEPVGWVLPTLIGPGYRNFEDIVGPLREAGLVAVVEASGLGDRLMDLLRTTPKRGPGWQGHAALPPGIGGALENSWRLIQPFLPRLG